MPNRNKQKGTRFEYTIKHALQMLNFEVIRAWSSIGTADLIASPPWNKLNNYRTLLIQCKNSAKKDYLSPFERDHMTNLQQRNAGIAIVVYTDNRKIMCKIWETGEKMLFETFLGKTYGIKCNIRELEKRYNMWERPLHLYPPPKDENEKIIAPFADLYSVKAYYAHVSERYKL